MRFTDRQRVLYVPTRLAPETRATTRAYRYSKAPPAQVTTVLEAYKAAIEHSSEFRARLSSAAFSTPHLAGASTPELAVALKRSANRQLTHRSRKNPAVDGIAAQPPQQLQQALRQLKVDDPALMLRAAAIDYAAKDLVRQAAASVRQRDQADREVLQNQKPRPRRSSSHAQAATTASQDQQDAPRIAGHSGPAEPKRIPASPDPVGNLRSRVKPDRPTSPASKGR